MEKGIESLIHYPVPIHGQKPTKDLRRDPEGLCAAEHHAATCLSIPCHPQMADNEIESVISAINDFR